MNEIKLSFNSKIRTDSKTFFFTRFRTAKYCLKRYVLDGRHVGFPNDLAGIGNCRPKINNRNIYVTQKKLIIEYLWLHFFLQ